MIFNTELCPNFFSVNVSVLAAVFHSEISKNWQSCLKISAFLKCRRNSIASTERSQNINYDVILHDISLPIYPLHFPKILPHSITIKNAKKLSIFSENDSRRLSTFLQIHIFWNFDHSFRIYNQINYRNILFPKVTIILIMTVQVLFFNVFLKRPAP